MLPAVLGLMLIVGVISFAMSLVATLELSSARSVADAVAARATAAAALALALAEVSDVHAAGVQTPLDPGTMPRQLGPWPAYAIEATATLEPAATWPPGGASPTGAYRLTARASTGRAFAVTSVVVVLEPALAVLERR